LVAGEVEVEVEEAEVSDRWRGFNERAPLVLFLPRDPAVKAAKGAAAEAARPGKEARSMGVALNRSKA
jgi:hypothetical protein